MAARESSEVKREVGYPEQETEPPTSQTVEREASQRRARQASEQALSFAGLLLAPERGEAKDPALARLLLRESMIGAVRALGGRRSFQTLSELRAALEISEDLPQALRGPRWLAACAALESEAPPNATELLEVESAVAELVRAAARAQRPRRGRRWFIAGAVLLVAALVVGLPRLFLAPSWFDYEWQASSVAEDFPKSGTLREHHKSLVFHTGQENGPWVLIDMKEPRRISQIVLRNRTDCCKERGLPLVVEVGATREAFTVLGTMREVFDEWKPSFEPREARYVRLRSEANTYLHLKDVEIR